MTLTIVGTISFIAGFIFAFVDMKWRADRLRDARDFEHKARIAAHIKLYNALSDIDDLKEEVHCAENERDSAYNERDAAIEEADHLRERLEETKSRLYTMEHYS